MAQTRPWIARPGSIGLLLVFLFPLALLVIGWSLRGQLPAPKPRPGRLPETHWAPAASIDIPRDDFGMAIVDGRLWVLGGMTGERGNKLDSIEIYDPATDVWSKGPAMPVGRSSHRSVAIGQTIYSFGGSASDDATLPLAEALDAATGGWRQLAPMPTARFGHAVVEVGGRVYTVGGHDGRAGTGVVEVYDPASDAWSSAAPLPTARYNLQAVVLGGKIYTLGGWHNDAPSATVEVYDPATNSWAAGPAMGAAMSNFGATVSDGRIHALHHADHQVFDPSANRWIAGRAMPTTRHGQGVIALGENVYAIGGCYEDPQYDLTTNEVLKPGPAPEAPAFISGRSTGGSLAVVLGLTSMAAILAAVMWWQRGKRPAHNRDDDEGVIG